MNLVLGSLLLFILISPGLIFRFSYLQGTYAKLTFKVSAVEEIFWAVLISFFLQLSAVFFVENVVGYKIRTDVIIQLVTGNQNVNFDVVHQNIPWFLLYTLILLIISALIGLLIRQVVRKYRLDQKVQFLRFGN